MKLRPLSPKTFLRLLLAMPLVLPLLVAGVGGESALAAFLLLSLVFGGVPYCLTTVILWVRLKRCRSEASAFGLMASAPLLFASLQAVTLLAWASLHRSDSSSFADVFALTFMGLMVGYLYVLCALILFLGSTRMGLVARYPADESEQVEHEGTPGSV